MGAGMGTDREAEVEVGVGAKVETVAGVMNPAEGNSAPEPRDERAEAVNG